jgi:flagella basal body P-ring formation protein FlgA
MLRIITFTLLMALAGPATAQTIGTRAQINPKLKELVTVTSEVVRIGDLIDNAGTAADIAVFRSPDLGHTGSVSVTRVLEALRPHRFTDLDAGDLTEVVVTRLSRAVPIKEIEALIARSLVGQYDFGEAKNITVTFDREPRTLHVESSIAGDLRIARLRIEPRTGRFDVVFELPGNAVAQRNALRFTGRAVETVEVAILTRALNRGAIIKVSDVASERRPKAAVAGEPISAETANGLAVKRPLRPGTVLQSADLMKAEIVQRNEPVTIVYEVPGILLTMRGKALEAGAAGDLVSVLNIQSNRTIQATVIGPGRVNIAAMTPFYTAAVPAADSANEPPPSAE